MQFVTKQSTARFEIYEIITYESRRNSRHMYRKDLSQLIKYIFLIFRPRLRINYLENG